MFGKSQVLYINPASHISVFKYNCSQSQVRNAKSGSDCLHMKLPDWNKITDQDQT